MMTDSVRDRIRSKYFELRTRCDEFQQVIEFFERRGRAGLGGQARGLEQLRALLTETRNEIFLLLTEALDYY